MHYCFLTTPLHSHAHTFHASAPTGKLVVHIIKPIIAYVLKSLKVLHLLNIIHADMHNNIISILTTLLIHICIDIKADNILFLGPNTSEIEETITKEPPLIDGSFKFKRMQYPILQSQPFQPRISWDASSFVAGTIQVVLNNLSTSMQTPVFSDLCRWN